MADHIVAERKAHTEQVIGKLTKTLREQLGERESSLIGDHTCVYATGSCGRGEMGAGSDLDAYMVRVSDAVPDDSAMVLEAAVKVANDAAGLPELDGGGRYLKMANARDLLDLLGSPKDDSEGVLTKRILLLLESRVLLGDAAHRTLIDRVIDAYWSNEHLHSDDYLPFMLVNDIVRYWRIVLLNHESKLREREGEIEQDPRVNADSAKEELLAKLQHDEHVRVEVPREGSKFTKLMFELVQELGEGRPLHRHMLV